MSAQDLLADDRFASTLGIRLVSASDERVVVEVDMDQDGFVGPGGANPGVAFSLADCAMSLISNSTAKAVAVATHLTFIGGGQGASRLRAEIAPVSPLDRRSVTWLATITADDTRLATFTGTTLRVG